MAVVAVAAVAAVAVAVAIVVFSRNVKVVRHISPTLPSESSTENLTTVEIVALNDSVLLMATPQPWHTSNSYRTRHSEIWKQR